MKILALDMGDRWIGTALSDELGITARPYRTIENKNFFSFLDHILTQEKITTIVVGHPKTMSGSESDQTKKIVAQVNELRKKIPSINWVLWDERLTSKQASHIKKTRTAAEKMQSHSIAAALILKSYLDYVDFQKSLSQNHE